MPPPAVVPSEARPWVSLHHGRVWLAPEMKSTHDWEDSSGNVCPPKASGQLLLPKDTAEVWLNFGYPFRHKGDLYAVAPQWTPLLEDVCNKEEFEALVDCMMKSFEESPSKTCWCCCWQMTDIMFYKPEGHSKKALEAHSKRFPRPVRLVKGVGMNVCRPMVDTPSYQGRDHTGKMPDDREWPPSGFNVVVTVHPRGDELRTRWPGRSH